MTIRVTDYRQMPRVLPWLAGLWLVVILVALVWGVGNAETKLREATRSYLEETGLDIAVDISGRDATLYGSVQSEDEAALIIAAIDAIPGVREVNTELVVIQPEPLDAVAPRVSLRLVGDAVSLRGALPDAEQAEAIRVAAREQFGEDRVVESITVSELVTDAAWLGRIKNVFPPLGELRTGGFVVDSDGFVLSGEVISDSIKEQVEQELRLVLADSVSLISNLSIAALPSPRFTASRSGGVVTLEGRLPNQETVDRIADATRRLHPGTTIINSLRIGEVAGANWLDSIDGLLDVVTRLDPWRIEVNEGGVVITGLSADQDLVNAIEVLAQEVVADQLDVVTNVQIDPAAIAFQLTQLLQGVPVFEPDGVTPAAAGRAALDDVVTILAANSGVSVVVAAHTDDLGDAAGNLVLSQQQADAVVAYLVAGGIDRERLIAIGYGESQPIADNATEEGRAENRRIEFLIEEGEQ